MKTIIDIIAGIMASVGIIILDTDMPIELHYCVKVIASFLLISSAALIIPLYHAYSKKG